jgi:hypothetical protein
MVRVFSEKSHSTEYTRKFPVTFLEVPKHCRLSNGLDSRKPQYSRSAATTASKLLKAEFLLSMICF